MTKFNLKYSDRFLLKFQLFLLRPLYFDETNVEIYQHLLFLAFSFLKNSFDFLEMFAGCAVLTGACSTVGFWCDIYYVAAFKWYFFILLVSKPIKTRKQRHLRKFTTTR